MDLVEQALLNTDMEFLFNTLFDKADDGEISLQHVGNFFPADVKERCEKLPEEGG